MSRKISLLLVFAGGLALLAVVATAQEPSKRAHTAAKKDSPDAWLTAKVKLALLTTKDVPGMAIKVDTMHDVVTLHGKVATKAEKERAEDVAKGIDGVKGVKNLVQVVPEARKEIVEKADDQIKDVLEKKLEADKGLGDVKVKAVDKGVVILSGKAKVTAALRAVETAYATAGVRQVASEIELEK